MDPTGCKVKRYIDLSHTIEQGMITYKGLPAPVICDYLSREKSRGIYAEGTEFQIGKIEMISNTGTYVDTPFHRYENGKDLSEIVIEKLVDLDAITIQADYRHGIEVGKSFFENKSLKGKAVLINTGWSKFWRTDAYFENHPFLTEEAAIYLRDQGVSLVGIDSHNMDDTRGNSRPAHTLLLGAEIILAEHLCGLDQLPESGFTFTAVPPKVKGFGTFPVRAFATLKA
ncbi:MAG: cyclase [Azospira oryzae]|nr:MAG: cyclase [Azospira oryzae]